MIAGDVRLPGLAAAPRPGRSTAATEPPRRAGPVDRRGPARRRRPPRHRAPHPGRGGAGGTPAAARLVAAADAGLAPALAERLLELPGERPPIAVAEIASGLLAAGRQEAGVMVAERLAADTRSAPLQEWAERILRR